MSNISDDAFVVAQIWFTDFGLAFSTYLIECDVQLIKFLLMMD